MSLVKHWKGKDIELTNETVVEDILSIINDICFGTKYLGYRVNYGSKGTMELIIKNIKEKYGIDD